MAKKKNNNKFGVTVDQVTNELSLAVETAVNFMTSEFSETWERSERYYDGGTDLKDTIGRSNTVKTEVRDTIRALKPSVMRTLLQARKPVEYVPATIFGAQLAEQQSLFVTQLFWGQGGYKMLLSAIDESLKKKIGPVKCYWESDPKPEYVRATGVSAADLQVIMQAPDCEVESVEVNEPVSIGNAGASSQSPLPVADMPAPASTGAGPQMGMSPVPSEGTQMTSIGGPPAAGVAGPPPASNEGLAGGETYYDVEFYRYSTNGKVRMEAFPAIEFFVDRNASSLEEAIVHGHRRDVTVGEAIELGLEYHDWRQLGPNDPAQSEFVGESKERRGYQKDRMNEDTEDLANHRFLLTECYCQYDIDGTGVPQKYLFWLGGTGYEYLGHEKIEDYCIDLVQVDPIPFTVIGRSVSDLVMASQDLNSSILRAITDNFHMANNPRPYANPMLIDFSDLMNNAIGAPIKTKQGGEIGTYDIPFTGQQGLPLLQYLETDVQNKTGVTKASQGLDPNAMQSTDKEAVQNTIMLAQGQVELIVRNVIETALIPLFKRLLRMSIRHMDRVQMVRTKGLVVPLSTSMIDPDLVAVPNVGLGTCSPEQKTQSLLFFMQKQEQYLQEYGLDNPLVGLNNLYNTIEDIAELSGFFDVGRYFKLVTPEIESLLAQQRNEAAQKEQAQAQENVPMDPSKAMVAIEGGKARVEQMKILSTRESEAKKLELDAIRFQEESDYKRDKMAQDRVINLLKLQEESKKAQADAQIRREQERNNKVALNGSGTRKPAGKGSTAGSEEPVSQ